MKEWQKLSLIVGVFLFAYYMPLSNSRFTGAVIESLYMLQDYARLHVLTCLVPAFFIAGAIANFISQAAVIKYFGREAKKWLSYAVASVSGTILAVCSCTVLPLFAGIYKRGAGIGPAVAFLYSGPAINVLAIIMTARILGWKLGIARALGAITFAVVIGLIMELLFGKEDKERTSKIGLIGSSDQEEGRTLYQEIIYFTNLVLILIFTAWGKPAQPVGFFSAVYAVKWYITAILMASLSLILYHWFKKEELVSWVDSSWGFAKQITPLLFGGVLVAGFLMGRPEVDAGIIPARYVASVVGGNSLFANFLASVVGAFMYFATLTEVPILQGLLGSGMGQGPALAMLLAGPALSLPNMLVINSVLGPKKTVTYVSLVVIMATITGYIFGVLF
ncbi:permease [Thermosediminibacter oceani]|uniref:Permease n=1 Tax=Thermosediminibacter oceani (strain ATCC BAA-1034 / DSM 16646 / JW/IW-1228P) TaxID=555079 RepID=D9RZS0_THEOJ|nr:permease [Thermosediminibacter oceani]ADL08697.1 permease [Thermosediminibacter oceani DSM 16646]